MIIMIIIIIVIISKTSVCFCSCLCFLLFPFDVFLIYLFFLFVFISEFAMNVGKRGGRKHHHQNGGGMRQHHHRGRGEKRTPRTRKEGRCNITQTRRKASPPRKRVVRGKQAPRRVRLCPALHPVQRHIMVTFTQHVDWCSTLRHSGCVVRHVGSVFPESHQTANLPPLMLFTRQTRPANVEGRCWKKLQLF